MLLYFYLILLFAFCIDYLEAEQRHDNQSFSPTTTTNQKLLLPRVVITTQQVIVIVFIFVDAFILAIICVIISEFEKAHLRAINSSSNGQA